MTKPNIFRYTNYRLFLLDWLESQGYSYRSFCARFSSFVSTIALAKLLSRGKRKKEPLGTYRMAPESLARLAKAMGLGPAEIRHLLLLRLENDADELPGKYGTTYKREMRQLVEENREAAAHQEVGAGTIAQQSGSESASLLYEFFELLPSRSRQSALEEVILLGRIYAGRQAGKPGVKRLQSLLDRMERLYEMGAP